ncbi:ABC transporter substrate-binding protein [Brasilonema octagenarum]|uniref:Branched-chain amino acid ABC transporter substrate-binding protein n=1 Tax=Brasilonema octagenarum UFV-OR1 TaxID=417115 RepID=A0ABX1MD24_9CYAN|nr:ABC transporter substrate-binding protein [Brasilonema octagenarum]NMF66514.1 branched-chain amino acid ABC transporter substrate-binding protein [Brasilonema octagenarum UFV-OR1]
MKQPTTITTAIFATCAILLTACGGGTSSPNTGTNSTPNSSTDAAATTTSGSIPVGIAFAQTSNVALLGQEGVAGAKIAEKYFNDKGGVNGTPIKLVLQDAGGDEAGAINAFQTLINKDKVVGIVGPTLSQQAFSADPIAERAKVPVIGASNTAKGVPEIGDYIARVSAPVSTVAPLSIKAALKQNPQLKKVAVFFAQNDVFSKSETEIFQKTIKDQGLEIVTVQKFQTSDTDFQSQATNALNLKPDLIVISGLAADGGNLVRQLRELGYKGLIVAGNGLNTAKVFAVCQQACDGVIIAQAYSPQQPAEVNKQFRAAYVKQFKEEPPQFSGQAFTAVQVYVEALKALDKKSKISTMSITKLRTELNKQLLGGKYETPLGEIAFTPVGDIIQKEFYVAQIKVDKDTKKATFSILK